MSHDVHLLKEQDPNQKTRKDVNSRNGMLGRSTTLFIDGGKAEAECNSEPKPRGTRCRSSQTLRSGFTVSLDGREYRSDVEKILPSKNCSERDPMAMVVLGLRSSDTGKAHYQNAVGPSMYA